MSLRKDQYVWLGVGIALAVIVAIAAAFIWSYAAKMSTLRVGDETFKVQLAVTEEQRARGLSGVTEMDDNEAMLFVYRENQIAHIWMKDMQIPIDVVWLDDEKRVIYIVTHLKPESYPATYGPDKPVKYLIEFPAGAVERTNIRMGTPIAFNDPPVREEG